VGGGHAQLARPLAASGFRITVTGSEAVCRERLDRSLPPGSFGFEVCDAGRLPFPDRSFDAVLCRFVVHHLADPARALAELARVCRPGGRIVVADLVALDEGVADRHNALERLRDPSHTTALTEDGLAAALAAAGLAVGARDTVDRPLELEPWIERAHTPEAGAQRIRAALEAEMAGAGPPTGLRPARGEDGVVRVAQRWVRLVARQA